MGREVEWKFRASAEALAAIQKGFSGWETIDMETAYFDTPDGELNRRKWMLRRRLENGRAITTVKTPLPDGSRGEWETEVDFSEAAKELCKLGGPPELAAFWEKGLIQVCAARFTRRAALVTLPRCTVELALDQGSFLAGEREELFCELEVELKDGEEDAAAAFAGCLAAQYGLEPETKSKAQRARDLSHP